MNKEEIPYELLARYFSGQASPEQAMSAEDWQAASPENRRDFGCYGRLYGWSEQLRGSGYAATDRAKLGELTCKPEIRILRFSARRIAAAAAVAGVILAGVWVYTVRRPAQVTVFAAIGYAKTIRLESAEITLHRGATLTLSKDRKVTLKGRAEFIVRHSEVPFIVDIQRFHVKDLGTRFRIDAPEGSDTILVTVTEGKVMAYDDTGSNVIIAAGEQATYIRSQQKLTLLQKPTMPDMTRLSQSSPDTLQVQPTQPSQDSTNRKGKGRVQKKRVVPADKQPRTKGPRTQGSRTKASRTGN